MEIKLLQTFAITFELHYMGKYILLDVRKGNW